MWGWMASAWGTLGIFLLLGSAVYRLSPLVLEAFAMPLSWFHWLVAILWVVAMIYSEGYKGFQTSFSPRVAARIVYLKRNPTWLRGSLAPFFCIGYFYAVRRRLIATWALTTTIVIFVIIVHQIPQPWRGIIDAGVVAGLVWGMISLVVFLARAADPEYPHSPQVPAGG